MKHKRVTAVALVAILVAAGAVGSALGTPGSGITATPHARGTLERDHRGHHGHWDKRKKPVRIELSRPSDVAVQQVIVAPGGTTGWHSHPGPAVVIVKAGALTLYDANDRRCKGTTYSAGKVFIDPGRGHVHVGRNEGTTNTELYVTFLDVPVGADPRIDVPRPGNCSF
jgi:quercetin dioxygenase-like cupin family protein